MTTNPFEGTFTIKRLVQSVSEGMMLPASEVMSENRQRPYVLARGIAIHFAREMGMSYALIGRRLNRDHSTIIHAHRNIYQWMGLYTLARQVFDRHQLLFVSAREAPVAHVLAYHDAKAKASPPDSKPAKACFASRAELLRFQAAKEALDYDQNNRREGSGRLTQAIAAAGGWR